MNLKMEFRNFFRKLFVSKNAEFFADFKFFEVVLKLLLKMSLHSR
jgi:hypothetical protein